MENENGSYLVYVQNIDGEPLMPTRRFGKVRQMLKSGQAVIVDYVRFTIRLTYQTTNYVQKVTLGLDTGSVHTGISVSTEKRELYSSEVDLRSRNIKKNLKKKSEARSIRRSRLRHRQSRFNNRIRTKHKGWLAPSMQHRIDSQVRIVADVSRILPIHKYIVEIGLFDTQKISNLEISGKEYQNGLKTDFPNTKAFVRFRDKYTCQQCKGKSGDKKIEVHHIQHKNDGGSDRPDNLVCLCHTCHDNHHNNGLKLKKFKLNSKNAKSLRDAAAMNIIKDRVIERIRKMFPDKEVRKTFGYITNYNRRKYNIEKSHANDAFVIAGNFNAVPLEYCYRGMQRRRHNRKIHKDKIQKSGLKKNQQAAHLVYGFALMDRVLFKGEEYFVYSRREQGSAKGYFVLKDIDMRTVTDSAHISKLKLIRHEKCTIYKKTFKKASADSSGEGKDLAVSSAHII